MQGGWANRLLTVPRLASASAHLLEAPVLLVQQSQGHVQSLPCTRGVAYGRVRCVVELPGGRWLRSLTTAGPRRTHTNRTQVTALGPNQQTLDNPLPTGLLPLLPAPPLRSPPAPPVPGRAPGAPPAAAAAWPPPWRPPPVRHHQRARRRRQAARRRQRGSPRPGRGCCRRVARCLGSTLHQSATVRTRRSASVLPASSIKCFLHTALQLRQVP